MNDISAIAAAADDSIRDVIARMDRTGKGLILVLDGDRRLLGTITDGDIRRAILAKLDVDQPVSIVLERRVAEGGMPAITVPAGTSVESGLQLMRELTIRHVPVLDAAGRVESVMLLDEILKSGEMTMSAVVVAGGQGLRLLPLTADVPKPMLPLGERPLLEHIVRQLQRAGIRRVSVTTHYLPKVISDHFGDGREFGVEIQYLQESTPLGTAGALGHLRDSAEPLLVINGDILTGLDFRAMLDFHTDHQADLTMAVREHRVETPYGVVEHNGADVMRIVEKPVLSQFINAGIYLLNPGVCDLVPPGTRLDMPELISSLLGLKRRVISFPVREYWRDIGRPEDYEMAMEDVRQGTIER